MKKLKLRVLPILVVVGLLLTGCEAVQNTNNSQRGAAIGAAAGAGLGALIGKNNRALGAIVGGVVGGSAGAIIGKKMDKQAQEIGQALPGAEVKRSEEGIQVILDENSEVRFEYNKSSLTPEAKQNLAKVIKVFKEYPDTNIMVVGYTDNVGSQSYNQPLSQKRAQSVADFLISNGIAKNRLTVVGMGKEDPRYSNDTPQGRAGNRRVEFAITANEKMKAEAKAEAGE
ncbi:OmpA family protein [Ornithobacterium rhinotracheale]|uniref:Outer membrane protein/peptidoglycan-associated (Lipo)protein n=1 Tax=Ornithobacterium rhinotracheale (strain ATCC 51463 / DSM 15997 / CCUG 23171 / CIP 104009 / LMG 9086) TaxID=867902 RepID=I3ZZL6_ORNRL|nr:OmpA family protein [Ornithobacterium rhinotracheale]AFL97150.1 outer membrane protein/peptidoglycan-associated (lipo)protein [Ornithobacterium rhinotracheale DSM 15997]AIP99249.1 membrane protein [Ornithobacterium rhinotracheale ORT-UMN 88]KGB67107.1 membrane protein [Ornithobacterium rhinotracheale H06-030791]MBN3662345.1 OmpA family protein [Ornithobacterium rhinotracheale]MCK0194328.1 OmpA family protein [Ornithobacterium rhinotracheale]